MKFFNCVSLILCISVASGQNSNNFKFCVNKYNTEQCPILQKGNSQVSCVPVTDSADCALKLRNGEAHFAIFSAEEALLVSKFLNNDLRVIGEMRNRELVNESYAFQTVVLVRESFTGGLQGLQSTNYCHPGFGDGQFWSDSVLKEFEKTVVKPYCLSEKSTAEQEANSLASFFKSACRPGKWAFDDLLDKKLKKKYPSLCALCDSPSRCAYNEDQQGSHKEALACLTGKLGDVAYVSLQYAKEYFEPRPGNDFKAEDYKFLCNNGGYQPFAQPCSWIKQPWPVVVVSKDKISALKPQLPGWLCNKASSECKKTWKEAFTTLFEGPTNSYVQFSDNDGTFLDNYLRRGRNLPRESEDDSCRKNIRWCTVTPPENEKCEWLKQAVIAQGIEPRLTCVSSTSTWSCLDLIKKGKADILGIDSDYLFAAKNIFNLTAAIYLETSSQQNYQILAIVRNNTNITTLASLKGKKACFPEYNGLAWNSFVAVAKKQSLLPSFCPYLKAVSAFFSDVCAPGIKDINHKDYNNATVPENMCSLCSKKINITKDDCEANFSNKYYGDFGAFSCLADMVSDVAFVNYADVFQKNKQLAKTADEKSYRILCRNGTLLPMLDPAKIPENCEWSSGIGAEIVMRSSDKKNEKRDVVEMLLKMNDRFGEFSSGFDKVMHMYGPFNNRPGLMFKESTVDLIPVYDQNKYVSALIELETSVSEKCIEKNGSVTNFVLSKFMVVLCSIVYIKIVL